MSELESKRKIIQFDVSYERKLLVFELMWLYKLNENQYFLKNYSLNKVSIEIDEQKREYLKKKK